MFKKSVEKVIEEGLQSLNERVRDIRREQASAEEAVARCKAEIQNLTELAKEVNDKLFDRYTSVSAVTLLKRHAWSAPATLDLGDGMQPLRPVMGQEHLPPGKYRAIVLFERLEAIE